MAVGLEETIVALLGGNSSVQALLGNPVRFFPNKADEGAAFPHAVYFQASGQPVQCLDGPTTLNDYGMEIHVTDLTAAGAKGAARVLVGVLSGYRGNVSSGYLRVQGTFLDEQADTYVPPLHEDDIGFHTVELSLRFWFTQT